MACDGCTTADPALAAGVPTGQDGITALHWAASHGAVDVIDELVRRGANVNAMSDAVRSHLPLARQPGNAPRHVTRAIAPRQGARGGWII
jgi:ankyrin repeat protein